MPSERDCLGIVSKLDHVQAAALVIQIEAAFSFWLLRNVKLRDHGRPLAVHDVTCTSFWSPENKLRSATAEIE